eukprot:Em0019g701a
MEKIEDVSVEACVASKFVQPYRVKYRQNGKVKLWDCVKSHDSVAILIYNKTRKAIVLVRQFRPAVYMAKHSFLLQKSDVFTTSLSAKPSSGDHNSHPPAQSGPETEALGSGAETEVLGSGALGCTYEMCAGILDKATSIEQIAREEILEETGYNVPLESIKPITCVLSSVGIAGSRMHIFYTEVTDEMLLSHGGGNECEGEMIEVVHLPLERTTDFVLNASEPRSTGLCFALMWFEHYKKPYL